MPVLLVQAVVLALAQGVATFLPVSASGHREGVAYLAAWEGGDAGFELALHLGTLAAVLLYFRADLRYLASGVLALGRTGPSERAHARRTVGLLVVGSVPALLAGWWIEPPLTAALTPERLLAGALYVTALLLAATEWRLRRRRAAETGTTVRALSPAQRRVDTGRHEGTATVPDVLVVGLAQALAVVPGLSRTAVTIAGGAARGLSRAGATRLSLLLSVPVLAGAALGTVGELGRSTAGTAPFGAAHLVAAGLVTAVAGYGAIRFLLRLVEHEDLLGFARWVALFATLILFASLFAIG